VTPRHSRREGCGLIYEELKILDDLWAYLINELLGTNLAKITLMLISIGMLELALRDKVAP
jgi:hypothetical protein